MLGPYRVRPESRRQGLYGRLLAHSIAVCEDRHKVPLLIFSDTWNTPSQRGIEKAGFVRLGVYETTCSCFRLIFTYRIIEQDKTLEDVIGAS
jgi:GNAT superfamily N-acetyltransferase